MNTSELISTAVPTAKPTRKVTIASIGSYVGLAALLGVLQALGMHPEVLGDNSIVTIFVTPLIPTAVTFVSGYLTKHAPGDLPPAQ